MSTTPLFTQETVDCIAMAVPQMNVRDQRQLKVCLCSPDACPREDLLDRLINFFPEIHINSIYIGNTHDEKLRSILGPLLVWGLSQKWANACDVQSSLFIWTSILKRFPTYSTMTPANIGISLLPLLDAAPLQLKEQKKQDLWAHCYRALSPMVPWERYPDASAMMMLAQLSCRNEDAIIGGERLSDHWQRHIVNLIVGANYYDQKSLLDTFIESTLPKNYRMSMLNAAKPLLWLHSKLIPSIIILLPSQECTRSLELPWVSASSLSDGMTVFRNHDINRRLYKEYCPNLYAGLSLVAPNDSDWQDNQYILNYIDLFSANSSTEMLPLPKDLTFDENDLTL